MGTTISPLLNPVIRGLWWMLVAKVCLLDSIMRRLLEADSNTTIASNIPLCPFFLPHIFTFFFLGFICISFLVLPSLHPVNLFHFPFSIPFLFPLHFLIRIFISLTISSCSPLFPTSILTHKPLYSFRPCLIPLWWTLHLETQNYEFKTILLLLYSFTLLPFFIYNQSYPSSHARYLLPLFKNFILFRLHFAILSLTYLCRLTCTILLSNTMYEFMRFSPFAYNCAESEKRNAIRVVSFSFFWQLDWKFLSIIHKLSIPSCRIRMYSMSMPLPPSSLSMMSLSIAWHYSIYYLVACLKMPLSESITSTCTKLNELPTGGLRLANNNPLPHYP